MALAIFLLSLVFCFLWKFCLICFLKRHHCFSVLLVLLYEFNFYIHPSFSHFLRSTLWTCFLSPVIWSSLFTLLNLDRVRNCYLSCYYYLTRHKNSFLGNVSAKDKRSFSLIFVIHTLFHSTDKLLPFCCHAVLKLMMGWTSLMHHQHVPVWTEVKILFCFWQVY